MCLESLKPNPDFFFPPVAASYEILRKLARGIKNSEGDFLIVPSAWNAPTTTAQSFW